MRLCSSLPANRSVCARRAPGEEVCRSRWTEHPPGGDFHLAISGDFEMAIDTFPVAAKESCAPGCHVCAASSTLTLIRLLRATCATRSVDPLGEGLAWWVAAGAKFRVFTTRRVAVWITSRSPFPMPETYAYFPSGENVVM